MYIYIYMYLDSQVAIAFLSHCCWFLGQSEWSKAATGDPGMYIYIYVCMYVYTYGKFPGGVSSKPSNNQRTLKNGHALENKDKHIKPQTAGTSPAKKVSRQYESKSKPGFNIVYPEPCKELTRRLHPFLVGTKSSSTRVLSKWRICKVSL